ncbi:MAG: hypothetical protein JW827_12120 [Spirochaetes bacterium]|nr:hypothetical protein [Spirochaetota bacterium]
MIKKIWIVILIMSIPVFIFSAGAASSIMNLNPIAYDAGMNIACYGKAESLESLVYNPAYACQNAHTIGISGGLMGLDINYLSVAYLGKSPFGRNVGWGGVFKYLSTGSIQGYNETGTATETIALSDFAFSGVFGWKLSDNFNLGTRINVINEKITESSTGYGFDLAGGMKTTLFKQTSLNFGVTLLNVYSELWDERQPIGIGAGLVLDTKLAEKKALDYGIGLKLDETEDFEIGGSVRYSGIFHMGSNEMDFKIGAGYYYSNDIELLHGIKAGILIGFLKNMHAGYDFLFRPWGTENRISLSYTITTI